jgi:hypothetical protein
MRVMTEHPRSTKAVSGLAVLLALAGHAPAQQPAGPARLSCAAQQALEVARSGAPAALSTWGAFASIQGAHATATATAKRAESGWPRRMKSRVAVVRAVEFQIPACYTGQQPRQGQTVFLSADGKTGGFISFPIRVPDTDECVGRGPAKGCFIIRSNEVQVSNTGLVAGRTTVISEDAIYGFQGNVEVRLQDQYGNDLWMGHVVCRGVNMRSNETVPWSDTVPRDVVLQTARVKVYQYNASCGDDKVKAFFDDLKAGADAVGDVIKVVAAVVK